jgi:hypothetical protein
MPRLGPERHIAQPVLDGLIVIALAAMNHDLALKLFNPKPIRASAGWAWAMILALRSLFQLKTANDRVTKLRPASGWKLAFSVLIG